MAGKPAEAAPPLAVVVTPEEARRIEWEAHKAKDEAWQAEQRAAGNEPCPDCGAYKGYNPVSGVQIRTHFGREDVDGHRDNCPRNLSSKAKKSRPRGRDASEV